MNYQQIFDNQMSFIEVKYQLSVSSSILNARICWFGLVLDCLMDKNVIWQHYLDLKYNSLVMCTSSPFAKKYISKVDSF